MVGGFYGATSQRPQQHYIALLARWEASQYTPILLLLLSSGMVFQMVWVVAAQIVLVTGWEASQSRWLEGLVARWEASMVGPCLALVKRSEAIQY